jgi:hypothetical protein
MSEVFRLLSLLIGAFVLVAVFLSTFAVTEQDCAGAETVGYCG